MIINSVVNLFCYECFHSLSGSANSVVYGTHARHSHKYSVRTQTRVKMYIRLFLNLWHSTIFIYIISYISCYVFL